MTAKNPAVREWLQESTASHTEQKLRDNRRQSGAGDFPWCSKTTRAELNTDNKKIESIGLLHISYPIDRLFHGSQQTKLRLIQQRECLSSHSPICSFDYFKAEAV